MNPRGWLIAVASRRLIDALRAETSRTRREEVAFAQEPPSGADVPDEDDTLTVLFLCCHPALSPPSQLALTLRAVGGLTTARDRHRVPRARGDDGSAHQPRQGDDR